MFLVTSSLIPVSLGQTCFVLVLSHPITSQDNVYPEMDFTQTSRLSLISDRRFSIIVFGLSVEDTGRPTYVVIDFMRRMFPVNAGTVVVPYYPVKNDMILVQGDDEDSFWKAHVIKYNLKQKTLTVRFFMKRAGDNIWVPENTRAQDVHLDSVIGIDFEGTWANRYTHWEEY